MNLNLRPASECKFDAVSLGEVMLRLDPGEGRIRTARSFRAWEGGPIPAIHETRDLGLMLYDMDYSNPRDIQPMFFRARLENGVLEVAGQEVLR